MQFFKVKKWLKEQQKPHQLTNQRFTVNSSSSSSPPKKGKSQLLLTSVHAYSMMSIHAGVVCCGFLIFSTNYYPITSVVRKNFVG